MRNPSNKWSDERDAVQAISLIHHPRIQNGQRGGKKDKRIGTMVPRFQPLFSGSCLLCMEIAGRHTDIGQRASSGQVNRQTLPRMGKETVLLSEHGWAI